MSYDDKSYVEESQRQAFLQAIEAELLMLTHSAKNAQMLVRMLDKKWSWNINKDILLRIQTAKDELNCVFGLLHQSIRDVRDTSGKPTPDTGP